MDGFSALGPKERARLKRKFLRQAEAAFERMFDPGVQDQLVTFTQREDLAVELGQKLTGELLHDHVAGDSQVQPCGTSAVCCPKCKQAAERVTQPKEKLPERELATRAGTIKLAREQWRCRRCRRLFFSARPTAATGDGRV
jgi:hypothetical protein